MHNRYISVTVQDMPTTSRIEKLFFDIPQLHRINTQSNQRCYDLSRRCVDLQNYQGADKRVLAIKSRLIEKDFTNNKKNLTQKQSLALVFWDTPFQRRD